MTARKPEEAPASGTITKIEAQKRNAERVSIFVDDEFAFGVHRDVLRAFDLREGQHIDRALRERIEQADARSVARSRALNYLARRARTVMEMRRYLRRKDFDDDVIDNVVAEFEEEGRLDDRAYALEFAEERFRLKGHGPKRIESDLYKRGVARQWIEQAVEAVRSKVDLREAAREHARERWDYLEGRESDPRKRRKKMYDYLRRRGFSYDLIRDAVDEVETQHE